MAALPPSHAASAALPFWRLWFLGFTVPTPSGAPPSARLGFALWRACIVIVPLAGIAAGFPLMAAGRSMLAVASELTSSPLLILFTLGLILLIAFFVWMLGVIIYAIGFTLVFLGVAFAAALNAVLGGTAAGRIRSIGGGAALLISTGAVFMIPFMMVMGQWDTPLGSLSIAALGAGTVVPIVAGGLLLSAGHDAVIGSGPPVAVGHPIRLMQESAPVPAYGIGGGAAATQPPSAPLPTADDPYGPGPSATGSVADAPVHAVRSRPPATPKTNGVPYECPRCHKRYQMRTAPPPGTPCPACR